MQGRGVNALINTHPRNYASSFLLFSVLTSAPSHLDYWQDTVPVSWVGELFEGGATPAV